MMASDSAPLTLNPVGHEWLVAKALKLELESNSKAGYDGVSKKGIRYQIKGQRVTPTDNSRQLSSIRKLEDKQFDYTAAVIYDENFDVLEARLIPHEVVLEYAKYIKHVNGHKLSMKGPIMTDKRVKCFKCKLED
jgi:hypothetical protein